MDRPTDPEGIEAHDIYAHFGLAMYAAQCVERQLVILAPMLLGMDPQRTSRAQLEKLWDDLFRRPMGQALRYFDRSVGLPAGFEDRLHRAHRLRNWLAHDFFWERAGHFLSPAGREAMRAELSDALEFLMDLDSELVKVAHDWQHAIGVSEEVVLAEMQLLILNPDGP